MREAVRAELNGKFGGMHPAVFEALGSPTKAIGCTMELLGKTNTYASHIHTHEDGTKLAALVLGVWSQCHQGTPQTHPFPREMFA